MVESCACASLPDFSKLINLDGNQRQTIGGISLSLLCSHFNHVELINGVPGLERAKVLSSLLVILEAKLNFVVHTPSPKDIIGLLDAMHDLGLSESELKTFCKKVICFERKSVMGVYGDMSLQSRIETTKKFFGSPGWRYFINLTVQLLDHFTGDRFKTEFIPASSQLKECIIYLKSEVPKLKWNSNEIKELEKNIKEINELICRPGTNGTSSVDAATHDLNKKKIRCAELLKGLKATLVSLVLPTFKSQDEVKDFCIRNSRVIFCSTNSAFRLNNMDQQIDCLIIDGADRVDETDMLVPLCLPSLRSLVLTGESKVKMLIDMYNVFYFELLHIYGILPHAN